MIMNKFIIFSQVFNDRCGTNQMITIQNRESQGFINQSRATRLKREMNPWR